MITGLVTSSFNEIRGWALAHPRILGALVAIGAMAMHRCGNRFRKLSSWFWNQSQTNQMALKRRRQEERIRRLWSQIDLNQIAFPEQSWSKESLIALIHHYYLLQETKMRGILSSGNLFMPCDENPPYLNLSGTDQFLAMRELFTAAAKVTQFWDPKQNELLPLIEFQAIQLMGSLLGGDPIRIEGTIVSTLESSIQQAARIYCNWGKTKGINRGKIIAPISFHPSLQVAAKLHPFDLILIPTNEQGEIDFEELEESVDENRGHLLAIFCSFPTHSKGVVDPLLLIAKLASEHRCGLHVDLSLGVFVATNPLLKMENITSVSAPYDQYGLAPKGCVALIGQPLPDHTHFLHHLNEDPVNWEGGTYVPSTPIAVASPSAQFQALLAMLAMGREKYEKIGRKLQKRAEEMARLIESIEGLKLVRKPILPTVVFRLKKMNSSEEASLFFEKMKELGIHLTHLSDDSFNFCLTCEFITTLDSMERFKGALLEALRDKSKKNRASLATELDPTH